ncbi:DUF1284 domain-containing protein [Bacillus xiapuensis]|uniref:DUF1284 domain-containing protein n=1 Tax=Bacillus xiapuensis TaxID=2014075 RepID=UPI002FCDA993
MGYSPAFIEKMQEIVTKMKDEQSDFRIEVVAGFDEACCSCPHKGESICEASEDSQMQVMGFDEKVIQHLGIHKNKTYLKSELIERTAERTEPDDLEYLCDGCSWLSAGVCKDGIRRLKQARQAR